MAFSGGDAAEGGSTDVEQEHAQSSEEQDQGDLPLSYEDMLALGDLAGKVSKGLNAEALSRLPVQPVCSLRGTGAAMLLDRCCICQLEFEDDDEATPLPCRHCYHRSVPQYVQEKPGDEAMSEANLPVLLQA
ncbi:hypothetical protein GPECTOR_96g719 [Gonium pectorale]|uniref:RING-type domain-containing protein n=1 Tax=Gonium pectorale TaxID=33097 RepID=A0A150G049_GONPE|nr:hypothetical protein GPECTOR_96g719 [Gonium pectorale]|eukprot:KXZ43253.1 hypothetical protein GPECTOR_96g719 [Gonium pectorale]